MTSVTFSGDAPTVDLPCFSFVDCTIFYPRDNDTWNYNVRSYIGNSNPTIKWVAKHADDEPHIMAGTWYCDSDYHWQECTRCDFESEKTENAFGSDWRSNENEHWRECVCGQKIDQEPHTWFDGACIYCGTEKPNSNISTAAGSSELVDDPVKVPGLPVVFVIVGVSATVVVAAIVDLLVVKKRKKS